MGTLPEIHLHPMLVHFPIALFFSSLIFEIFSLLFRKEHLHQTSFNLFVFAIICTPFALLTGFREAQELHLKHHVLDIHQTFAYATFISSLCGLLILWYIRKKNQPAFRKLFLVILICVACCVSVTAYNGGRMVYEYAVGVETN